MAESTKGGLTLRELYVCECAEDTHGCLDITVELGLTHIPYAALYCIKGENRAVM